MALETLVFTIGILTSIGFGLLGFALYVLVGHVEELKAKVKLLESAISC